MANWFECRVKYDKMLENGMQKKVTEPYLVDALSFTEAEARIIEEVSPFISGEFPVSSKKSSLKLARFFLMKQVIGGINVNSILSLSTRKAVWKNVRHRICLCKPQILKRH